MSAAPIAIFPRLLSSTSRDAIFERLLCSADRFDIGSTTIGVRTDGRRTSVLADVAGALGPEVTRTFARALADAFRRARPQLGLPPLTVREVELQASVYLDGGFYQPHRDIGPNNTRRVTWVYYLHRAPKRFSGGELILYDTDLEHDGCYDSNASQRCEPVDNQLIFFPSEYFHEVCATYCPSGDFADARFTLNGWFHTDDAPRTAAEGAR